MSQCTSGLSSCLSARVLASKRLISLLPKRDKGQGPPALKGAMAAEHSGNSHENYLKIAVNRPASRVLRVQLSFFREGEVITSADLPEARETRFHG